MGYLGKHRVFRPMRRHPVVIASGAATALVIATTGIVFAKIAQDAPPNEVRQVASGTPTEAASANPSAGNLTPQAVNIPGADGPIGAPNPTGAVSGDGAVRGGDGEGTTNQAPDKSSPPPMPSSPKPAGSKAPPIPPPAS